MLTVPCCTVGQLIAYFNHLLFMRYNTIHLLGSLKGFSYLIYRVCLSMDKHSCVLPSVFYSACFLGDFCRLAKKQRLTFGMQAP